MMMQISKPAIGIVLLGGVFILIHYLMISDFSSNDRKSISSSSFHSFNSRESKQVLPVPLLSDLFGYEYEASNTLGSDSSLEEENSVLLNQVKVRIRAISTVAERKIVYISYLQENNTEETKIKLLVGDDVLGFTLVKANERELVFKSQDIEVRHEIFKRKK